MSTSNQDFLPYYAFISYRHLKSDRKWAKWLHSSIETYKVPKRLVKQGKPARIKPVFRDEEETAASSDLSNTIETALKESRFLIVVCSPETPNSPWVNEEIVRFRQLKRENNILSLLINGEPNESFPQALRDIRPETKNAERNDLTGFEITEPLAADVRPVTGESKCYRKRMALLKIIAALLDCEFDELRQRDQERRIRNLIFTGSVLALLSAVLISLTIYANTQRKQARASAEESHHRLVRVTVGTGSQLIEQNDWLGALPWFADALRLDSGDKEKEQIHRLRLATTIKQSPQLKQILFHVGAVRTAMFDSSGRRIVTASMDGSARVWDVQSGNPLSPPLRVKLANIIVKGVNHAIFSPDGKWIATESDIIDTSDWKLNKPSNIVQLWDTKTWSPAASICYTSYNPYNQISFSPDGNYILTPGLGARVWEASTGKPISPPLQIKKSISTNYASFSPDGKMVVTADDDGKARLWNAYNGEILAPPMDHNNLVNSSESTKSLCHVEFCRDGKRIVTSSQGGTARVWDVRGQAITPELLHLNDMGKASPVVHATFSYDGQRIATAGSDGVVRVWDANNGEIISRSIKSLRGARDMISHVSFSPDGQYVVSSGEDRRARIWDAQNGMQVSSTMFHADVVNYASFSPDGKLLVTCSEDGTTRLWKVPAGNSVLKVMQTNQKEPFNTAGFSPDGQLLAVVKSNGMLQLWSTLTWKYRQIKTGFTDFTPPLIYWGKDVIVLSVPGQEARMWSLKTYQQSTLPEEIHNKVLGISRDGTKIVVVPDGVSVQVWNTNPWKPLSPMIQHKDNIYTIPGNLKVFHERIIHANLSPDNTKMVTANLGSTIRVWDAKTGKELTPTIKHLAPFIGDDENSLPITSAEFSPDGRLLLTSSTDRTARIWEANSGRPAYLPLQHALSINRARFNAKGNLVVTLSADGKARVWDVVNSEQVTPPLGNNLCDIVFSKSNHCLLGLRNDGWIQVFDLTPEAESVQQIQLYSQVSSMRRIDSTGGSALLETGEIKTLWETLNRKQNKVGNDRFSK